MRITTRGRYALRAMAALAKLQDKGLIPIKQLADEERISVVFLEQIFFKLRKAGIVKSTRGPGGGFQFTRGMEQITLLEIFEAAGEETNITDCDKNAKACEITGRSCAAHQVWKNLTALIRDYLGKTTLAAVLAQEKEETLLPAG